MRVEHALRACLLWSAVAATACDQPVDQGDSEQPLRDSSRFEAIADFDQMTSALRALYGPLVRKEHRYNFDFEREVARTRLALLASKSDSDTFRITSRFLDRLHDGHVSYSPSVLSDTSRQIAVPLLVTPVEAKFLVNAVGAALQSQVAIGDELLLIDGRTPHDLVERFGRFESVPHPKTEAQLAATSVTFRSFLLPRQFLPQPGTTATLRFARPNGTTYEVSTPWLSNRPPPRLAAPPRAGAALRRPYAIASDTLQDVIHARPDDAAASDIGRNRPFFLTPAVQQQFAITPVRPSDATLASFAVPACDGSSTWECYQSFAGTYTYKGKRVLLVRIPSYVPSTAPGTAFDSTYVKAILKDFQASTDVLVIDQTNNPGGSVYTAVDILSALITQPAINVGFAMHADRKSINDLRAFSDEVAALGPDFAGLAAKIAEAADATEIAYDEKQPLGPLFPFIQYDPTGADDRIPPDPLVQWGKPIVVLSNELSFSGGDLFPMLVKANRLGTLFGETTGGLGGNVEDVLTTSFSQGSLRVTRSIFAPMTEQGEIPFGSVVEDEGVTPDVKHTLGVRDFRAGFVGYVTAFSDVAVGATR